MATIDEQKKIIRRVWKNKGNNQKLVTIPKDSNIEDGDYVEVIKQWMISQTEKQEQD